MLQPQDIDYLLDPETADTREPGSWSGPEPTECYLPELENRTQLERELYMVAQGPPDRRHIHFRNARNMLFSEVALAKHRWADHRSQSIWADSFTSWWGPAASVKTTDAAANALTYWLAAPQRTYICCCSTTVPQLDKRVWGEILRLYRDICTRFPEIEAVTAYRKQDREIQYIGPSPKGVSTKNVIRGVAIMSGDPDEAIGNVIGTHNDRIMLIVDEAQVSRTALIDARINLRKGTEDFKLQLMGNPTAQLDPLGLHSEPTEGYASILQEMVHKPYEYVSPGLTKLFVAKHGRQPDPEEMYKVTKVAEIPTTKVNWWRTAINGNPLGICFFYNGFLAPSLDSPEEAKRLKFMIQGTDIHEDLDEYGPEDRYFFTMSLGFLPPEGTTTQPFTLAHFTTADCIDRTPWAEEYTTIMSVDPSFSMGGDKFMIKIAKVGVDVEGRRRIHFEPPLPVRTTRLSGAPFDNFTCLETARTMHQWGVTPRNTICDTSGNHGTHPRLIEAYYGLLKKYPEYLELPFATIWSELKDQNNHDYNDQILRFSAQVKAETWVDVDQGTAGDKKFRNIRTQAYYLLRSFLNHNHLSGVSASNRRVLSNIKSKKDDPTRPSPFIQLEDKADIKSRIRQSPDEEDAMSMAAFLLRKRFAFTPGDHNTFEVYLGDTHEPEFEDLDITVNMHQLPSFHGIDFVIAGRYEGSFDYD